jgi:hypothetical protein
VIAYLSPQEASQTIRAGFMDALAKQAKGHEKQQGDVDRGADENVTIGNVLVGHCTSSRSRYRSNADLGVDESRKSAYNSG